MTTCRRTLAIAAVVAFLPLPAGLAQGTREDYQRAQQFLPGNLGHRVYVADVIPHWIAERNRFWYRKAGTKGTEFILVDAQQNASGPAFDRARLAAYLSKAGTRESQTTELPFDTFDYAKDGRSISLQVDGMPWTCQLENYECKREPEPVAGQYEQASPNKEWVAYVKEHDLYLRYAPTGEIVRLTHDGTESWDYATPIPSLRPMVAQGTQDIKHRPAVFWSPDSSKLVTYRMDTRSAGRFTNLQFVPPDQLRPKAYTVIYPLPGEVLPQAQPIIFDIQKSKRIEVKTIPLEIQFQGGPGFTWFPDSKGFYYDYPERGEKAIEPRAVDAETGEQRVVIREQSERYVDPGETFFRFLRDSGEVLWSSERDGWNHLYLYNLKTGQVKNQVTQGPWVFRQIVDVDEKARRAYFLANGRESSEDPYQPHLYSIGFDGKGLASLTPENANHAVSLSPDHSYFVDNASRPDLPGQSVLRNAKDGSQLRVLEQTDDAELLKTGWKPAEPFQGKAADGTTSLYGLIWRPSNFDSAKKYPIIAMVYTGP